MIPADGDAELHCHLDGSVRIRTIRALAAEQGITVPEPLERAARAPEGRADLVSYISAIDVALEVLQTPEALERAAFELVEDWAGDGVRHGEARFAPSLHGRRGVGMEEAIAAVASGLARGGASTGVSAGLICCVLRPSSALASWDLVETALASGVVVGVDVSGPERGFSLLPHAPAFRAAREGGLRVTVHAGEADGPRSVWEAVDELGAERIGHGVRSIHDAALVARLAADGIALEVCPTSNVQTGAVASLAQHPLDLLSAAGVPVTISCDARTVSGVTLSGEFAVLAATRGWDAVDREEARQAAWAAAFLAPEPAL